MREKLKYIVTLISVSCCIALLVPVSGNSAVTDNTEISGSTLRQWSPWSGCSASCDKGTQMRWRRCNTGENCSGTVEQTRQCHELICPSYLGYPRLHFAGHLVVDTPTSNNFRCLFNAKAFCPTCNTERYESVMSTILTKNGPTLRKHYFAPLQANAMGTGHFYFTEAFTKSVCWEPGKPCSKSDPITNRAVGYTVPGRMVDLDPDWETAPEMVGYDLHIPGVLTGTCLNGATIMINKRVAHGRGDTATMGTIKTKIVNIKWLDGYYKNKFNNSTSLSLIFYMDIFSYATSRGRVVGTIGMTSDDDPINFYGGRVMRCIPPTLKRRVKESREIPFSFDRKNKIVVLDMGNGIRSASKGNFSIKYLKHIDLVVYPESVHKVCGKWDIECLSRFIHCGAEKSVFLLTSGGKLDYLQKSNDWYTKYGGIVEVSLKHLNDHTLNLLLDNRIGLVNRSSVEGDHPSTSKKPAYTLCGVFPWLCKSNPNVSCNFVSLEDPYGINFKPTERFTNRLSRGETWNITTVTTSYGRPLKGGEMELRLINTPHAVQQCHLDNGSSCPTRLAVPKSVLKISEPTLSDNNGLAQLSVTVMRSPGNPRKCGIDGQLYAAGLIAKYSPPNGGDKVTIGDGGMFTNGLRGPLNQRAKKQCGLDIVKSTHNFAFRVFSSLPASVMRKTCPTWVDDIRPIFQYYYNLFPVMQDHDIINLRDINDVRRQLHRVNMSMFEYDWSHPNFMPTTRDLSPDKTEIVRRWLECEMNGTPEKPRVENKKNLKTVKTSICGTRENLRATMVDIRSILQMGIWLELYTIPPYMTAMFSLKRELVQDVYTTLKSIATEEMLHMILDANVLNAVGGKPNTTDAHWLPNYPTTFPSIDFYQINPGLWLTLEKFSTSIVKEVFSEIEKPSPLAVQEALLDIALLWRHLPDDTGGRMKYLEQGGAEIYYDSATKSNTTGPVWLRNAVSRETFPEALGDFDQKNSDFWESVFQFVTNQLDGPEIADVYTFGGFYAHAMLRLIQAEACVKMDSPNNTVFTGAPTRQFGPEQWYVTKGLSSATLFPVHGLKSAIEALMEVVYEGEGGTSCASVAQKQAITPAPSPKDISKTKTLTHYVKFQEIVHGKRLVEVDEVQPQWPTDVCFQISNTICSCVNHTSSTVNDCPHFCYIGEPMQIAKTDSVWPGIFLHLKKLKNATAEAKYQSHKFNAEYTSLLQCLETAMNGKPTKMTTCMGVMYELSTTGKTLVKIPIYKSSNSGTVLPTWTYIKESYKLNGLTNTVPTSHVAVKFC
nr:uncharacterized protein LOC100186290 isoform X1 [Ciona intestinalis]|eukprot:XP_018673405.1 uncharacterized protein LOC100186290 isoform X1 [Ciona intestinalis]